MGTVYLAMASGLGAFRKLLVVKELRHDLPWKESSLTMFLDEAQLAARLDHPNVLQTFEAGEAEGRYFLAMEYLDGQPLSSVIERAHAQGGIPLELHVHILCEVLGGLQYAHDLTDYDGSRLHVVHRDVSPQNVFVTHHGQVKVVDFGVAKANNGSNITSPGVFKGKFAYAAPEQLLGRPVDGRCDVFAVGVMLWEAIAGRRFGVAKPTVDAFRIRTNGLEPKIHEVAPEVDPLLAEICGRALAIDPLARTESAGALRAQLQEWLSLQGEHVKHEDVAAFMRELFSEERKARRLVIERAMVDAGATHSVIAELPRELLERESGSAPRIMVEAMAEPSHTSTATPSRPAAAAAPRLRSRAIPQGLPGLPTIPLEPARGGRKGISRLGSAAILVGLAVGVFFATFQLSKRATETETVPALREITSVPLQPTAAQDPDAVPHGRSADGVNTLLTETRAPAASPLSARDSHGNASAPTPATTDRKLSESDDRLRAPEAQPAETQGTRSLSAQPVFSPKARLGRPASGAGVVTTLNAATASPQAPLLGVGTRRHADTAATAPGKSRQPPNTTPSAPTMGADMRPARNSDGMRIDTEDPYR
jgi:serine/threonine-protein kinase